MSEPIPTIWTGEAFEPMGSTWRKRADQRYVVGQRYLVEPSEERSMASHRAFFAAINEAWMNLPERVAEQYPTADKLRKHALIRTGYRDEKSIVCASKAEALRVAAFIQDVDDYAVIVVTGAVVTRYTAKSQSMKAMGKEAFQKSKDDVLDWIAALIGVDRTALPQKPTEVAA